MLNISFNFINKIKRNFFPFYKDKELKFVFNKIQEGTSADTVTARFVGGCVRKYLSNNKIDDIDIATTLSTGDIKEKFKDNENLVVASPDVGGVVRARAFAKRLNAGLAIVDKRREKAGESEVMNIIGEIEN